ncbi:DUF896 domain-containing protein [Aliicoccus persicus]|uniref:UPF0291 protein SAMN05192557_0587 n=1 Tax=Aliicoccus persicus TaxID=930138 RepID=A0A662Z3X6_9STAP|nr:DUF896 domain-containing protein [Aliicoccus persicus]SEV86509.1 Uncharacterized protein YnzC, UPF0291/DUF896 family [Aliicoccus persicus]
MLEKENLARLNVLAKKKKMNAITKSELDELQKLRGKYLKNFRASFKKQIENTTVIDPEGNDVTPQKVVDTKNNNN